MTDSIVSFGGSRLSRVLSSALLSVCCWCLSAPLLKAQDPWPFDRPSLSSLRASNKKVFAHYFTPYPLAISNVHWLAPDYYQREYLSPYGEDSAGGDPAGPHRAFGGWLRERPLPTPVQTDTVNWERLNLEKEVETARQLGIDGFTLDVLGYGSGNTQWERCLKLMDAANNVDTGFKIVIMPDMNASPFRTTNTSAYANLKAAVRALSLKPAAYRHTVGGSTRLVVAPYNAHKYNAAWWQGWINDYNSTYGENIYFVPTFQGWATYAASFAPISHGFSDWGVRNTGTTPSATGNASTTWVNFSQSVHGYTNSGGQTLISMAPVAPQDYRPKNDNLYWEANNTLTFRKTWENAIQPSGASSAKADWVQIISWNDYSEHTEISPSTGIQHAFYDLTAYYTTWFKTGTQPTITRDTLYYSHRKQHSTAPYDAAYQTAGAPTLSGNTPVANFVEVVGFARNVSGNNNITLEINLNNGSAPVTQAFTAPGIFTLRTAVPSGSSDRCTPSFRMLRGGVEVQSVVSNYEINNHIVWSDLLYRSGSSRRAPVEGSYFAKVNFGGAVSGYFTDTGVAYGANGGTGIPAAFQFGWTDTSGTPTSNTHNQRNRNSVLSPDERYDTLVKTLNLGARNWQIAVPAGQYKVRLVGGDPTSPSGVAFKLSVNGVPLINSSTTGTVKWFDSSEPIVVPLGGTGLLQITSPAGANTQDNAANFIEITPW